MIILNILSSCQDIAHVSMRAEKENRIEACIVISYKPFYDTLFRKGITEYELIFKQGISANTLYRMKKGEAITTRTLDTLCSILDCSVSEILEYKKDTE